MVVGFKQRAPVLVMHHGYLPAQVSSESKRFGFGASNGAVTPHLKITTNGPKTPASFDRLRMRGRGP